MGLSFFNIELTQIQQETANNIKELLFVIPNIFLFLKHFSSQNILTHRNSIILKFLACESLFRFGL
jgi:type III secretory pathway component EscS